MTGSGEQGGVTVEAAITLAALVSVLVLCLGAVLCVSHQFRCQDAAREAARLA
ncbi:TadE family type IV pilus minor pilin, partial [Rhodococcus zopfii]